MTLYNPNILDHYTEQPEAHKSQYYVCTWLSFWQING